jgi:type II secretory pathway component GspD/PulD (secretin)
MIEAGKKYYGSIVASVLIALFVVPVCFGVDSTSGPGDQRILTTAQQQLQERVTFTCRDLPIDTVLMQLAEQAKVDIIKSPRVKGNVTVKITDVPLDEALNNILAAHGWTYVASENMIRVMPLAEVDTAKEKLATSIYQITYADVQDVANAIKSYVSDKGKIAFNKGTNHVIVTDLDAKIKAIDRFIAQIDRETPQIMVEARIYDITTTEGFELGADWTAGRNVPLTDVTHETEFDRDDTLTSPEDYTEKNAIWSAAGWDQHQDFLAGDLGLIDGTAGNGDGEADEPGIIEHDTPALRSYTETESVETTTTDKSWWTDSQGTQLPYRKSKPFIGGKFTQDGGGSLRFGLMNDMVDLDIELSLLSKQVEAKLLANPRVLVLDNETANIKIVKEIPYTESIQAVSAGGLTIARVQFKNVGVQLLVTPHIAREGMIRLKLKPEFGVEATVQNPGDKAQSAPAVDTRMLETIALVKDGQTVVMGGLRKKEIKKEISKVPLLGDMPLLGGLFRYETENEVTNELVVFITPNIVSTNVLTELEEKQLEATRIPSPDMSKAGTKKPTGVESGEVASPVQPEEDTNKG